MWRVFRGILCGGFRCEFEGKFEVLEHDTEGEIGQVGAGYEVASENLDRGVEGGKSVSVQETSMPGWYWYILRG